MAVKRTKETIDAAKTHNKSHLFIIRKKNATIGHVLWDKVNDLDEYYYSDYQIKETDMRVKTATFTTPEPLDLTTGQYCILIQTPNHETFGGEIIDWDYDVEKKVFKYQCQDFTREYQGKTDFWINNVSMHRVLKFLLSRGGIPLTGKISKKIKSGYEKSLSGLRPAYQYEQGVWADTKNFNPMNIKLSLIVKNKSRIEVIRDIVYGCGAYIDVYADYNGVIQIKPYSKSEWLNTGLVIGKNEILELSVKMSTTNIITNVNVQSSEQLGSSKNFTSASLTNLDLASIFGYMSTSISNPNKTTNKSSKKSSATKSTSNPYNTKSKTVYISSDNIYGRSTDKKFMKDIASLLKKQGWKTKIIGLGPNLHTEKYMGGCKNGVWFCIYGGADAGVFKETAGKNSYTNTLKKNNLRTVIGMRRGGDIRKGGKYYKWLPRAHDDNYSGSGFKGLSYPINVLTKGKVPIMYAGTAKKMVAKFLKGGDNPEAC